MESTSSDIRSSMARNLIVTASATLVGAASLVWVSGALADKVPPGEIATSVEMAGEGVATVTATYEETALLVQAVGTVQPRHDAALASKVMARIVQLNVSAGDHVTRGQLLVQLDSREQDARISAARQTVREAETDLLRAEQDAARSDALFTAGAEPARAHDRAVADVNAARARLAHANDRLTAETTVVDYTSIRAPSDGIVMEKHGDVGDLAVPGRPILTLYDPTALRLEAIVRESHVASLHIGDTLNVTIEATGTALSGQVEEIAPHASAATRTFVVKIALPRTPDLFPGMFGRVSIPRGTQRRLLVPRAAVLEMGQIQLVRVLRGDGTVVRRLVRTGRVVGDDVEISSGLSVEEANSIRLIVD